VTSMTDPTEFAEHTAAQVRDCGPGYTHTVDFREFGGKLRGSALIEMREDGDVNVRVYDAHEQSIGTLRLTGKMVDGLEGALAAMYDIVTDAARED
jgi:hypothetical protein